MKKYREDLVCVCGNKLPEHWYEEDEEYRCWDCVSEGITQTTSLSNKGENNG